ncbi:MAG: hypothetical protein JST58_10705 [Bacteroidetes bacterium]|nr:hypothetical protein [Bacteroidota bacterium]
MKNPISIILIVVLFCSCSSTNLVFISVKEPAPVTVPPYIKSVAIINRSLAKDENKTIDAIHRVLSLESKDLVLEGGKACINGLNDEFIANQRFENVVKLDSTAYRSFGAGVFPSQMDWETVEKICTETRTDALFSLELFDADTKLNYAAIPVKLNSVVGSIPAVQNNVSMNSFVKTGWRMYDPSNHTVLDESYITKDLQFSGSGINPVVAAAALIGKKEAIIQTGNAAGHVYASRVSPFWIRVNREYFVRGNDQLAVAKRKAQTGNWDEAGLIWEKETRNIKRKVAGRAFYNMAIINEINGNLDAAIQWAQKSYENYGIRIALQYVNILRNRKAKNQLLDMQATR